MLCVRKSAAHRGHLVAGRARTGGGRPGSLRALAAGVAVALLVTGAPSPAPAATPPPDRAPAIAWQPCEADATAECGTLSLPVDWDRPDGDRFDLHLARRTATDPTARLGSLVFGPGGPGDSGVHRIIANDRFSDDLRRRFDIVSFDPRGIGRSNPVLCSARLLARQPQVIADQAQFAATLAGNEALRADCRERTGPLFDHVDTGSAVRDLDAIRAALGERRLTFHGSSYGTLLGAQYAEQFPHRVRAMVLESAVDHSLGTRAFLDTQAAAAQDSFDEFVSWCARSTSCPLHREDVRAVWAGLFVRAERGELADPDRPGVGLSPYGLSRFAQRKLYGPDWAGLARQIVALRAAPPVGTTAASAGGQHEDASQPHPFAVFCADWHLPVRDHSEYAAHLRRMARIAPDLRYPQALPAVATCLGTPAPVANPQHRLRVRTDVPLLLASTRHDPASGYDWARNVSRQLGRSGVLLTYQGWGHGNYSRSACVQSAVDRYLISIEVPARGTRCPAVAPAGS
ncbi:alpha/beta hydrolase [Micromonospora sp. C28SCA-DRY-2]|uniref:alpha/beta hydrolase n=1 Tax=Micromonospora sp. C28SCA-DRY-2 TaxID=3059522 RepID=UPI0026771C91|nr:alpha/beta hydrolase [Micromonospora sp. C28SCA-DRY-2]MDO3701452.1 alpha/beta hydrolase [Micromonospora sp. C28SCA-DRY-2]